MNKENNLNQVPVRVDEIFEELSSGRFICANSVERTIKELYTIIEDKYEILSEYFAKIGYRIEKGESYFYLSKNYKNTDEKKLDKFYNYIDVLDFLKSFNSNFASGFTFTPSQIVHQCSVDLNLKDKLLDLKKEKNISGKITEILADLKKDGLIELVNPEEEIYKVLSSFAYLENLILMINIEDDVDEIA